MVRPYGLSTTEIIRLYIQTKRGKKMATPIHAHTDEARELATAGIVAPGDKTLDVPVTSMSDREIAEETLIHLRNQRDVVTGLIAEVMASPLGGMIASKGSGVFPFGR
jgi:hypothetical protein